MSEVNEKLLTYHLHRATETYTDAISSFNNNKLLLSANRFYYSLFYMMNAVLLSKGLSRSKHSGVISLFRKTFIKTKLIPTEASDIIGILYELRQDADYTPFFIVDDEYMENVKDKTRMALLKMIEYLTTLELNQELVKLINDSENIIKS